MRALRYHGYAAIPLVVMATLAQANGIELYHLAGMAAPGPALPKLINVIIRCDCAPKHSTHGCMYGALVAESS